MTLQDGIALIAALTLIAAFWCQSPKRLSVLALVSGGFFLWYAILSGSVLLIFLSGIFAVINLVRLRSLRKGRAPTRATWVMDDDVQERVDEIRAQSRYSSAGIEF